MKTIGLITRQYTLFGVLTALLTTSCMSGRRASEALQRVAQDFAQQHQTDQRVPPTEREGYTLLLGMRRWEFEAFARLRRLPGKSGTDAS